MKARVPDGRRQKSTPPPPPSHEALIVEDDPLIAEALGDQVRSLGHTPRFSTTLDDVRAAIREGGFCYVLLDMQFPASAGGRPAVASGTVALDEACACQAARGCPLRDGHVLPIIIVTGFSKDSDFVSKMHRRGADAFIEKPFFDRYDKIVDTIREELEKGERAEHAACVAALGGVVEHVSAPVPPQAATPAPKGVEMLIPIGASSSTASGSTSAWAS